MDVHAHDNLRTAEFAEGMLDAVGNVGGQSYLCLHLQVGSRGALLQSLQQSESLFAMLAGIVVVIHHIECHQVAAQLLVAHHERQFQQLWGYLGIFYAEQYLLVVLLMTMGYG